MAPPRYAGLTGRPLALTVSTVATMGFLLFGYDQGVMSGIISDPAFNDMFTATKDDDVMQATVTAVYEVGKSCCPLRDTTGAEVYRGHRLIG